MTPVDILDVCIASNAVVRDAMQAIGKGRIGAVIVVDDNKLIRVLTDGDIRRSLLEGIGLQSEVSNIEFVEPVVAFTTQTQEEILEMFSDRVRVIPVVDNDLHVVDVLFHDSRTHIALTNPLFDDDELQLVNECMISGWVSSNGKFINEFEKLMAEYCGVKYAISCSSATAGLHLALLSANIGVGDEVIVPTLTFVASANAVTYTGAKPVFIDSDINNWNIDPAKIEEAITPNTKAIMPVHLYGHPADMDLINSIADKHNVLVIEDAAEAHGAKYKNKIIGGLSDVSVFSFFGNKLITTGEGGMILTNDPDVANKCRLLRDHGMSPNKRYWHEVVGYNYRMTNLQAALGVGQMKKIDSIIDRKKNNAAIYESLLKNVPGVTLPPNQDWADNIYWLYTILINEAEVGVSSGFISNVLKQNNIDTRPVFYPMNIQPIYRVSCNKEFPVAEYISKSGISLPSAPDINAADIKKVCGVIIDNIKIT